MAYAGLAMEFNMCAIRYLVLGVCVGSEYAYA